MAFSDTAGGNVCLSLAFIMEKERGDLPLLYTNNPNFIDNDWNLPVNLIEDTTQIPGDISANYVFTGTSHPETSKGFELYFIKLAKRQNIHSVSIIDHWINFRMRFVLNDEIILPDQIWVLDEKARLAAVLDDLPADKLFIHQNPHHLFLSEYWKSKYPDKSYLNQLGLYTSDQTKVILFAPDPISLRYSHNELGFDETSALEELIKILVDIAEDTPVLLIIKKHPLQPGNLFEDLINQNDTTNLKCAIINKANNPELINCADVVIGFYSNFLLEARQMGKIVIRYFPTKVTRDPLAHIQNILPVVDVKNLGISLKKCLQNNE